MFNSSIISDAQLFELADLVDTVTISGAFVPKYIFHQDALILAIEILQRRCSYLDVTNLDIRLADSGVLSANVCFIPYLSNSFQQFAATRIGNRK